MAVATGPGRGLSPLVPLAYLTCAAAAFVAAALGIVWLAPELAGHYYQPRILALTHVVTLGWITLAIMGASYQLIPVVLDRPIWSERLARWQLGVLAIAVVGMVAHFWLGTWAGVAAPAALLAAGVAMHLVNVGMSVRGLPAWTAPARLAALGYVGLAATAVLGLALGVNHVWPRLPGPFFGTLHAHVHLALLGWVAPMILGVTARVYPMFLLAPAQAEGRARVHLWCLGLGVPAVVCGLLGAPGLLLPGVVAIAAATTSHAWWVIATARRRKRPTLDWSLRFAVTATVFVAPAAVLGVALATDELSGPRAALGYAVVVLGGWISLTIAGMMLEVVPFLVWYRAYAPRAGREPVPSLAQLASPPLEAAACVGLVAGVGALAIAVAAGNPLGIRAAGGVLALGAVAFAAALGRILRHLRPPAPAACRARPDRKADSSSTA